MKYSLSSVLSLFLVALGVVLVPDDSLIAGVVAYYRFEEGTGTSVVDSVDASIDGTHTGSYSADVAVGSIPLTGAPNNFSLQIGAGQSAYFTAQEFILHGSFTDATLEFWINIPEESHEPFFWTRGDSIDANRFNISINPGGRLGFDYRAPDGSLHAVLTPPENSSPFVIPLDTWTHVAVTRTVELSGAHTYRFYEDGALVTTAVDASPVLPTTALWQISGRSGFPFSGLLDEIRFSDTALSPDQFLDASQSVPEPSSVAVWGLLGIALIPRSVRLQCRRRNRE